MTVTGWRVKGMVKEQRNLPKETFMLENGLMIKCKAKEASFFLMESNISDNMKIVKCMATVA